MRWRGLPGGAGLVLMALASGATWGARPVAAQVVGEPLTVSEAARLALRLSPSVAAALAAEEGSHAALGEARSTYFPSLALSGSAVRFQKPMVVAPLHGFDPLSPPQFDRTLVQGDISLTWTLFDGGARGARLRRARALATSASESVSAARAGLLASATGAFLDLRTAREVLDAAQQRVAALSAEAERARRMLAAGRSADVDLLRAQAALSGARADSASAAAQAGAAARELARLLGVAPDSLLGRRLAAPTSPETPLPERAELLRRARASNPELARARAQAGAAAAAHGEARAAWLPRFQALGRYAEFGSAAGAYTGEWQGGVQLSYPLFTAGQRSGAVERTAAEARAADARAEVAEQATERALDGALASLESARSRVAALAAAVRQFQEVVRIERLSLSTGAGTQTDYLSAEASLYDARASLTRARYAAIAARVDVARITGELSLDWLERNLESGT